jgi:hypothetical protein
MDPAAITELLKLGLPGIVILALAYAYLRKDAKIDEINEKRIAEARESVKAIEQSTNALEGLTDILRDRKAGQ